MSRHAVIKPQQQEHQPGLESEMDPKPQDRMESYLPANKLKNKVAIITGGDSGIGRAVSIGYVKEGAKVVIVYLEEEEDAQATSKLVQEAGGQCLLIKGDIASPEFCRQIVDKTLSHFGKIDILVNNAGEQHEQYELEDITPGQLQRTFETNIFGMFYLTQEALKHMKKGSCIINTASITAYKGKKTLIDYSATKGAIVTFTRSLSENLVKKGIRVNGVAPGPIWTPLIPASFTAEEVAEFGKNTPMGRPGQPDEVAPAYIFLASQDASYISGQIIHPNGGTIVNG